MSRKPVEPDLSAIFASGATCSRCGKKADSFVQMEAENWYVPYPVDDNGDWISSEPPIAECSSCGAGWQRPERSERRCIGCDLPLKHSSELTPAWADGDNPDAYITCADCGYQNIFES